MVALLTVFIDNIFDNDGARIEKRRLGVFKGQAVMRKFFRAFLESQSNSMLACVLRR